MPVVKSYRQVDAAVSAAPAYARSRNVNLKTELAFPTPQRLAYICDTRVLRLASLLSYVSLPKRHDISS